MNIRLGPGKGMSVSRKPSIPQLRPVSQDLFLATGMLVPATDRRGLGSAKESPSHAYGNRLESPLQPLVERL
jgi:hypothetical protein